MKAANQMIRTSIVFLVLAMLLTGCTNGITTQYTYELKGESALWTASFVEKGKLVETKQDGRLQFDGSSSEELVVTYKNDLSELSKTNHIIIAYKAGTGSGQLDTEGPFVTKIFTMNSGGTGVNLEPYDQILVTVSMDGVIQEIVLDSISTTKTVTP